MLDGLESESAGRVCVMMTAMDVGNLPPALVRSGRISLWLETRLPDASARREILSRQLASGPDVLAGADVGAIAGATEGLSGADLEKTVSDARTLAAYDRARGIAPASATDYLRRAADAVRKNHARYARAEATARANRPHRPSWFEVGTHFGMEGEVDGAPASIE